MIIFGVDEKLIGTLYCCDFVLGWEMVVVIG